MELQTIVAELKLVRVPTDLAAAAASLETVSHLIFIHFTQKRLSA